MISSYDLYLEGSRDWIIASGGRCLEAFEKMTGKAVIPCMHIHLLKAVSDFEIAASLAAGNFMYHLFG